MYTILSTILILDPVLGVVWLELGDVALMEEVYPWEEALKFQKPTAIPSLISLLSVCGCTTELVALPANLTFDCRASFL